MKRCVVHIGMHKTGTTSIQNSLNLYEDPSFYYARIGGHGNHSVPVYSLFSEHPERHNLNRHRGQNPAVMAQYIQSIKADLERSISEAGDRTLIISGEDIGILKEADIARMHDALRPHYDDIQILAYVRPPMSFMNSALQQMVRSGGRAVLNFDKLYRSYRASYEKFDNVFGRDAVMLKLFDRKELRGGDVVKDFCATIGLDFPPDRIKRDNEFFQGIHHASLPVQQLLRGQRTRASLRKRSTPHQQCPERAWINKFSFAPSLLKSVLQEMPKNLLDRERMAGSSTTAPPR